MDGLGSGLMVVWVRLWRGHGRAVSLRRFGWSIGVVMLIFGATVGVILTAMWVSVIQHPDPGNLTRNMAVVTVGWVVWMLVGVALFRRCR